MKRTSLIILILSLMGSLLAACGGEKQGAGANNEGQGGTGNNPGKKITVSFWAVSADEPVFRALADQFTEQNPSIEIKITGHASDPHKEALKVAAASGTLPDMWFNWGGTLGSYFPENGFSYDFTQHAEDNQWKDKYLSSSLELAKLGGQMSGVPWKVSSLGFYYRKDIFEKYNLTPPKTFAEFEQVLAALKDNGITPITTGGKGGWHPMRIMEGLIEHYAGAEGHDRLVALEESWENNKPIIDAYAKWKEWSDKGYFPKGFLTLDPLEAKFPLFKGEAAMIMDSPGFNKLLIDDQQDPNLYGFFPMPTDTNRISSYIVMLQVNKNSAKVVQDAAIAFAEFITAPEVIEKNLDIVGFPQARIGSPISEKMPIGSTVVDAMNNNGAFLITDQALPQEVLQKFFQAQDDVSLNRLTPEQAAAFMQEGINNYKGRN
ncbi:ABC transporter substrate-binding protein [Paenibacillus macerans]|uniref:ABC transporter substrate-binding protein n=1 Tax=Paenibacillus macerans TaxID=44252 RepID=UPI0020418198|nr:ABC transporter substrate-binding protein [Paenibacillus macerans]MCM3699697.1 ABC transporter substrate-binding protein [Paenibacillus macerans]